MIKARENGNCFCNGNLLARGVWQLQIDLLLLCQRGIVFSYFWLHLIRSQINAGEQGEKWLEDWVLLFPEVGVVKLLLMLQLQNSGKKKYKKKIEKS